MLKAFTLIELLVVVTIIVVLLALLTPALDRAVYQAELAACGAKLKGLGTALAIYAADHKRSYPRRGWVEARVNERPIMMGYFVAAAALGKHDDRPVLRPYMSINGTLNCPLNKLVSYEPPDTEADSTPYANYGLWFGFNFTGNRGLKRVGDRLEYAGTKYGVLAGDWDGTYRDEQSDIASHPDDAGLMPHHEVRNYPFLVVDAKASYSFWQSPGKVRRGLVDMNYVFTDGGVERFSGVGAIATAAGQVPDERMENLPARLSGDAGDNWRVQIPAK